jgi:putative sigma-54 modulation protein
MQEQKSMKTTITGRHMEMTDALKSYIENGLNKIEAHFDRVTDADVVLDVEKHRHIAEVNLHANGVRIHSKETSSDMYASVDAVMAKLEKQVRKYKERISRHKPRNAREIRDYNHAIISAAPLGELSEEAEEGEEHRHHVVLREKLAMKPMSVDEAVMQLELIDDTFLVFFNAETSRVNVLYTRDNDTFGLIEPQF